jgi:diguanylate cyclase (GGDEF)-like protein
MPTDAVFCMLVSVTSFALITPTLFLVFSGMLLAAGRAWRSRDAQALGLALLCVSGGITVQTLVRPQSQIVPLWFIWSFSACYLTAAAGAAWAIALRLRVRRHWPLVAVCWAVVMLWQYWFTQVQASMPARVYGLSAGAIVIFSLPLWQWRAMRVRHCFDACLRWVCVMGVAVHVLRTMLQIPSGLEVPVAQYPQTTFWLGLHLFLIALCCTLAGLLVLGAWQDVLQRMNGERLQDPLTQLLNRRGFNEQLADAMARERRHPTAVGWGVLAMDLDHFKAVNDRWGHAAGDEVLQSVAHTLQQHIGRCDLLARFGGEEFIWLLADRTPAQTLQAAHQVRIALASTPQPCLQGASVTVCVGVSYMSQLTVDAMAQSMHRADRHLYAAKQAGRNGVVADALLN